MGTMDTIAAAKRELVAHIGVAQERRSLHGSEVLADKEQLVEYLAHTIDFPLEPIRNDAHLDEALAKLYSLSDQPELSAGERVYLEALSDLIWHYEEEHIRMPPVSGIDVLRHLMEENGLRQKDLAPIFGSKSTVSEVLRGKRPLALAHIVKLSERFGLPADVFIDRPNTAGSPPAESAGA